MDKNSVSRPTILTIRAAWVHHYKKMVMDLAAQRVGGAIASATIRRIPFVVLLIRHVQDEADMRMRSGEDHGGNLPSRSRSSKVQQQVVELFAGGDVLEIPTELEALGDNTAATLCTSLERCVRSVVADVVPAELRTAQPQASFRAMPQASTPPADVWLFHVMIGDVINTNNAAAKRLWACLQERGLGPRVRYFLAVIVCGTHQTGLAARGAVTGRAAAASAARGKLHEDIAGVTVRIFKYLINDYFDEFVFSINEWVVRELQVLQPHSADAVDAHAHQAAIQKLQTLYTEHVLPDELVALWNNGLHRLSHVVGAGEDPEAEKPRVVARMVQFIVKRLMIVDSSPTLSRIFTFRNCTDALLTMLLIGMPPQAFVLHRTKPQELNQKRLVKVMAFCNHPEAVPLCKRTALAFQMTGGCEALVSTNPVPKQGPPIVRLCEGGAD